MINSACFRFVVVLSFSAAGCFAQGVEQKPNIIFILADDLGYGDVEILNPHSKIPTPNMNALASQGISFTNAHATSSVCTPSRYSFLTGRYSWRTPRKKGVTWVWEGPMIQQRTYTIAEMLRDQGYATACIGKWHLGVDWRTTDGKPATLKDHGASVDYQQPIANGPVTHGFDYYFGQEVPSFPPHAFIENDRVAVQPTAYWRASQQGAVEGAMAPGWRYEDQLRTLCDTALQFIRRQAETDSPFFLYFPLSAPHTPIAPHEAFTGKTAVGRYGDFVYEMDFHIGRVIQLVDSLGLSANTLIIVTSDNGGVNEDGTPYVGEVGSLPDDYGHNSNSPWRGMKSDAWEGGHRVPFIVRWEGHVPGNLSSDKLISHIDMMATFASISGAQLPSDAAEDSYNALPLLEDPSSNGGRDFLVTLSGNGILAIQESEWKLILSSGGGGSWTEPKGELPVRVATKSGGHWRNIQLYHLGVDPREEKNLANFYPDQVTHLMRTLKGYITNGRSTDGPALPVADLWDETMWIEAVR